MYGVQEAVSSTLATRTKGGCQGQRERQIRKDLVLFLFFTASIAAAPAPSLCDGALAAYVQMAVDVRGHLDVRVAQPLLHVLQAVALLHKPLRKPHMHGVLAPPCRENSPTFMH